VNDVTASAITTAGNMLALLPGLVAASVILRRY